MYKIFLDSSIIVACGIETDAHHKDVHPLLKFIKEKYIEQYNLGKVFVVNEIVMLEAISKLIHKGYGVNKAIKEIQDFLKEFDVIVLDRGKQCLVKTIFNFYFEFKKKKFRKLQGNDFIIIADTIKCGALLSTCDADFQKSLPKNFKNSYYISSRSQKHKDQSNKLLERFLKSL